MASYGTDTASYGTNTVSYSLSGKKGLVELCSVLPPALVSFAVLQPNCSQCIVSYTVQPQGPFSVNYLRHCDNLPLSSV